MDTRNTLYTRKNMQSRRKSFSENVGFSVRTDKIYKFDPFGSSKNVQREVVWAIFLGPPHVTSPAAFLMTTVPFWLKQKYTCTIHHNSGSRMFTMLKQGAF